MGKLARINQPQRRAAWARHWRLFVLPRVARDVAYLAAVIQPAVQ